MGAYSAGYGLGSAYKRNPAPAPAGFPRATGQATISRYNPPNPTGGTPKVDTFTDDFATADTAKWQYPVTNIAVTGGQLQVTPTTGYPQIFSTEAWDLTGSSFHVEMVSAANLGNGGSSTFTGLFQTTAGLDGVFWQMDGATLYARYRVANATSNAAGGVAYSNTTHRWLRIREASGVIYWEASTDGTSWTAFANWTPTIAVTSLYANAGAGYGGTEPSPGTAVFDNVNQAGIPSGSGVGSWSFAGAGSGVRTPKASGIGAWTFAGTGSGKRTPKATGSGTFTFTGAGSGKRTPKATGVGSLTFTGAGSGTTVRRGTGAGTATWTGTGAGTSPRRGTGSGAWSFVGSGTGATVRRGSGSGTATWTGAGSGSAPGVGPSEGSGTGSWGYGGAGSGTRAPVGAGTGLATWVGTGEGAAPALAVHSGSGSGTWAYAGVGSGITGSALRDITLTVGPGRSRTLTATGTSRGLTVTGGRTRSLTAAGRSREIAAVGVSRTLTVNPRE